MIRLEKVTKIHRQDHQEVVALKDISLVITKAEFVAIMGPSGSGKSTLLNLIGGLDQPTSGRVAVDGHLISSLSDPQMTHLRRRAIGVIFQFFNLLPHLTVWENVALPLLLRGDSPPQIRSEVTKYLEAVGLSHRIRHRPHELSGGEQQRVAIARALVIGPRVLLADEPTGNLDTSIGAGILDLIKTCSKQEEVTVVLATHSHQAASYSDRIIHLKDGKIVD